jgi:hypothetical protein
MASGGVGRIRWRFGGAISNSKPDILMKVVKKATS